MNFKSSFAAADIFKFLIYLRSIYLIGLWVQGSRQAMQLTTSNGNASESNTTSLTAGRNGPMYATSCLLIG